ncbi:MAG: phosphoglucosamine mutase [Armatimonadetes bacterium]|nr:phosphoglucosamine mutase [Armatimonadota bacterium]
MGRLFGTDGIRGVANADLTPELVLRVARAAATVLGRGAPGRVMIGRDTRLSGPLLEAACVAGVCSVGGEAVRCGILPTPALAYLTVRGDAMCGVMLSASHNPIEDNGVKIFGRDGFKLPDPVEDEIERLLEGPDALPRPAGAALGEVADDPGSADRYLAWLVSLARGRLDGVRIVVDCAYGAAYDLAPCLWRELGATVIPLNAAPDGARINVGCGSTHPAVLQEAVRREHADLGFAHDGDADRVIAADERGNIVDGDGIIGVCALHLAARGDLPGRRVVTTTMSNLGLEQALARAGIALERTAVGDRFVLERMRELDAPLGGEQSGHVIFLRHATTGDGLLTGVQLANVLLESGRRLSELASMIERLPQVLHNVRVEQKAGLLDRPEVRRAIEEAEHALGRRGRLFVRPSGTEPLVRVMVEAATQEEAEATATAVAWAIARAAVGE